MITNLHKTDAKRTTHLRNLTHLADGLCCLSQEHQLAMKWTQKMRNTRPANRHGTAAKRNKACQWIKEREIKKIIINTLAGMIQIRISDPITQNIAHQRDQPIQPWKGCISSFYESWSKWSRITYSDPDYLEGLHPKSILVFLNKAYSVCGSSGKAFISEMLLGV